MSVNHTFNEKELLAEKVAKFKRHYSQKQPVFCTDINWKGGLTQAILSVNALRESEPEVETVRNCVQAEKGANCYN